MNVISFVFLELLFGLWEINTSLGNTRSNFAVNQNLWERKKSTHTKLLTEFGQCCLRLRTCYRSFIINPGNFTSSQLTPDPKYTQEITRNFLKKFFCEKKKNPPSLLLFPCSLCVFLFWDDFSLHLTLSIYRRSLGSRWT